ncbi:MAG: YfiR family protein [Flavobacteriales bacterium]|nr:YfiR family protein [Flavobacteriales bacterium]
MKYLLYILVFIIYSFSTVYGQSSAEKTNNKIKGIYVYQFAKNVDWPQKYKTGSFTIGVLGDKSFYEQLKGAYTGKQVGGQKIEVVFYASIEKVQSPHLLYVSPYNKETAIALAKKLKKDKTLIIGEEKGLLNNGIIINFLSKDNKLAFEISKSNAKKKELVISQTLTRLAVDVL